MEDYSKIKLPQDTDGPVFDHPWQAQAFSMIVHLNKQGHFAWKEWVDTFSKEIKASPDLPGESTNDAYYRQWIAALENMVTSLGVANSTEITERAEEWRKAYINTPHGQPIVLANAACPPAHDHNHSPKREPVKVSPAEI